jgi:hypothetical protein
MMSRFYEYTWFEKRTCGSGSEAADANDGLDLLFTIGQAKST